VLQRNFARTDPARAGCANPVATRTYLSLQTFVPNQAIDVLAGQLAQASFVAGASAGVDQLWVRASDGMQWSDWHPFMATSHG
jgi:hypothetical protein